MVIREILNFYVGFFDFLLNIFFFISNETTLRLIAFSIFMINLNYTLKRKGKNVLRIVLIILYSFYGALKFFSVDEMVMVIELKDILAFLPFLIYMIVPQIIYTTKLGKVFLTYKSVLVYYLIFNVVYYLVSPTSLNLIGVIIYVIILYLWAMMSEFQNDNED